MKSNDLVELMSIPLRLQNYRIQNQKAMRSSDIVQIINSKAFTALVVTACVAFLINHLNRTYQSWQLKKIEVS